MRSEFELTRLLGRDLGSVWVRAQNAPHAGGYDLRYADQPRSVQQLPTVRRLIEIIPGWHTVLQDQAAAVVACDAARADATADFETQRRPIDATLMAIDRQTLETLGFLNSTTQYNTAIADYVLAVLPADTPRPILLTALLLSTSVHESTTATRVAS